MIVFKFNYLNLLRKYIRLNLELTTTYIFFIMYFCDINIIMYKYISSIIQDIFFVTV